MRKSIQKNGFRIRAISLVAVGFGLLIIKEGGAILFGGEAAQSSAGNYVPFVLWFNFPAGFACVVAGAGLWLRHRWAVCLSARPRLDHLRGRIRGILSALERFHVNGAAGDAST